MIQPPINTFAGFNRIAQSTDNAVVCMMFTAKWCGPCQSLKPQLGKLKNVYTVDIDVGENGAIADSYSVVDLPTFIVFESGKEVARFWGANQSTAAKVEHWVGRY